MLKFFSKTLLISVLSGSLMTMNITAFAAEAATTNNSNTTSAQTPSAADQANNSIKNSAETKQLLKTSGSSGDGLMSTLTMTAIGILTSRLWKCKLTMDMMIAAGAGAAFLAGEVIATLKLKDVMKDLETQITRKENGELDQKQIEALQTLRKSYETAKESATTKKNLQTVAAMAFAAAALVAGYQYIQQTATDKACTAGLMAAGKACAALCAIPGNQMACAAAPQLEVSAGKENMTYALEAMPGPSSTTDVNVKTQEATNQAIESSTLACEASAAAVPVCTTNRTVKLFNKGVCLVPPVAYSIPDFLKSNYYANNFYTPKKPEVKTYGMIDLFKQIFMPEAQADLLSPMGIVSSAAISFVFATSATLGVQVDTMLFSPLNRAMIWGVLAGLSYAASSATDNQIKIIEGNIASIDAILNSMYAMANGVKTANNTTTAVKGTELTLMNKGLTNVNPNKSDLDLKGADGKGGLPCFTSDGGANCPTFNDKIITSDSTTLPSGLQAQVGEMGKLFKAINGAKTFTTSSASLASSLAGQSNAIQKDLKKMQSKLQTVLKDSGSKLDVARESKKFENGMLSTIQKELDKKKTTAGAMYASFGGGMGSSDNKATDASMPSETVQKAKTALSSGGGNFAIPSNPSSDMTLKLDKDKSDLAAEKVAAESALNANTATMDDYALKNDITQNKDTSIFDLISNRYQKSYDRLFNRTKEIVK
jgi:hypothetical protein